MCADTYKPAPILGLAALISEIGWKPKKFTNQLRVFFFIELKVPRDERTKDDDEHNRRYC